MAATRSTGSHAATPKTTALPTTKRPSRGERFKQSLKDFPERAQRFPNERPRAFMAIVVVVIAIVGVVDFFIVTGLALSAGKFGKASFPGKLAATVFWFNLVLMIPVILVMVMNFKNRFNYLLIRLGFMVVMFIFTLPPVFEWLVRYPLLGIGIWLQHLGFLPVLFHCFFAIALCSYKADDGTFATKQQSLKISNDAVLASQKTYNERQADVEERQKQFKQAQKEADKADKKEAKAAKSLKEAQERLAKTDESRDFEAYKKTVDTSREAYDRLNAEAERLSDAIDRAKLADEKSRLTVKLNQVNAQLAPLLPMFDPSDPAYYATKLEALEKAVDTSEVKAAEDARIKATEDKRIAREELKTVKAELGKARRDMRAAAGVHEKNQTEVKELEAEIADERTATWKVWRDVTLWPAAWLILTILTSAAPVGFVVENTL